MFRFEGRSGLRAVLIVALAGFWLAVLSEVTWAAVDRDVVLRGRLDEVRELLERRQAHRRMLGGQIEHLSDQLDRLQVERDAALAALVDQEDRARGYERELDRLIPRLLPRVKALESLRKQGARAIAGLARVGRDRGVKDETKARLLATNPVSIEQVRRVSASVRLLRRAPSDLAAQHRDIDFQIPLLAAAADRLSQRRDRLQNRRDAAIRELADLAVGIERLTAEEHRLARNLLARNLKVAARPAPSADGWNPASTDRRPRPLGKSTVGEARIKGMAIVSTQPSPMAPHPDGVSAQAGRSATSLAPTMPALSAGGKDSALVAGWTDQGKPDQVDSLSATGASPDVAMLESAPLESLPSRVARGHLDAGPPLIPTGETIGYTMGDAGRYKERPAIEVAALPRQRVAAPSDGRVVFAGEFRSYGLLLIIEHDSEYHTLLWGFSKLLTELGDHVRAGQIVGMMGADQTPTLYVELRRAGRPVSPEVWLAAGNSGVKG